MTRTTTEHRGDHPHVYTDGVCICGHLTGALTDRAYRDTHRDRLAESIAGMDAQRFPIMRTERELTFVSETGFTVDAWIGWRSFQRVGSALLTWGALVTALQLAPVARHRDVDGADTLAGLCAICKGADQHEPWCGPVNRMVRTATRS